MLLGLNAAGWGEQLLRWIRPRNDAATAPIRMRRSVAVLGFKNLSGTADEAWLSTALSEMLTTELAAGDQFGWAVALSDDGNLMVVGAPTEQSNARGVNGNQADNSSANAGAAYVFTRSGAA
jgi:TolB-like protein